MNRKSRDSGCREVILAHRFCWAGIICVKADACERASPFVRAVPRARLALRPRRRAWKPRGRAGRLCGRRALCSFAPLYSSFRACSMGSGDATPRTWSGPGGSSHKGPLAGTCSHRACLRAMSALGPRGSAPFDATATRRPGPAQPTWDVLLNGHGLNGRLTSGSMPGRCHGARAVRAGCAKVGAERDRAPVASRPTLPRCALRPTGPHRHGARPSGPDRKSTRLNSSHEIPSRMPSSA